MTLITVLEIALKTISAIGFDADDTLWESEIFFSEVEKKFAQLIESYGVEGDIGQELYATEKKNLAKFGYGVKSFTISMVESAHHLTRGDLRSADTMQMVQWGKDLLEHPVRLLPNVKEVLTSLQDTYFVLVITKGDPLHQLQKFEDSGLAHLVEGIEILQEKDSAAYRTVLEKIAVMPEHFLMVGNSVRSDILPVVEIGSHVVHIPHETTWQHETEYGETVHDRTYPVLESIAGLPGFLNSLDSSELA